MRTSAFSGQSKVTKMCLKYLLAHYYICSSQYKKLINRSVEIKQYTKVYTVYANTNMAGTRILCPIYTVDLGGARSDLVA